MPSTVVFRTEVNAYDKSSFWRDQNAIRTYLEQNYGLLKLIYYNDEPHGPTHRCVAVVRFRDCNVANQVKQSGKHHYMYHAAETIEGESACECHSSLDCQCESIQRKFFPQTFVEGIYNGRPLFGTRVTTTWLTMKQMKELGMVPCDDESDTLPRDKAFTPQQGDPFYARSPHDHRYARHLGGLSPSEGEPTSEKGATSGSSPVPEGLNPVLSPVWGASSPEGQRFPSPRMALRGGRGTRGFRRGWGRAPRGRGRGPPVLPRKHELIDKGKGNVSPPTKSRSKKRLFGPAYASPPPLKRPRRTHPIKEPSPDAARTVFDRLSPPGVVPPVGVMGAYGGEAREGSPFREDGSGDEAFVRELPMDAARTPLAKGEEGVGRRGFPPRNDKRERDVARMTIEEGGPLDVANWSPVHSSQGNMSPGHPSHSNWSPIHSSKDGWSSDLSPGHSIESKWSLKGTDLPNRNVQSPGHQSRTEEALEVTDNELLQSPDHPGTPGLSRGHLEGVKEPAVPSGRTVVEKMSKRNPHIYSPLDKENNPGLLDKETNRGPLDKEANKPLCKGLHNIDECADRKEVSCHSSGSVVEEHAIGGNVASTSGLGTRPRCGPSGDGGAGEEVPAHRDAQNAVKASIIKEFDMQASMLARSCKLLICDNSDQSKVIVASLTNSLMKLAEKLALKFHQYSDVQQ